MSEIFGVVGAGTMGNGIAQVAARAGYDVVMRDVADEFLSRGMTAIDKSLQRDVDKERLSADEKGAIVGRIKTTTELAALRDAFIVVEAVTEDFDVKSRSLSRARSNYNARRDSRFEYFIDLDHQTRRGDAATRQSHRHALHESGAGDEAGRESFAAPRLPMKPTKSPRAD